MKRIIAIYALGTLAAVIILPAYLLALRIEDPVVGYQVVKTDEQLSAYAITRSGKLYYKVINYDSNGEVEIIYWNAIVENIKQGAVSYNR